MPETPCKVLLNGGYPTVHIGGHYYWVWSTGEKHAKPQDCPQCLSEGKAPFWLRIRHFFLGCGKGPFRTIVMCEKVSCVVCGRITDLISWEP